MLNTSLIIIFKFHPEDLKLLDNPSKKILKDFSNEYEKALKISKESLEEIINQINR